MSEWTPKQKAYDGGLDVRANVQVSVLLLSLWLVEGKQGMALSSIEFLNEASDLHAKMMEHGGRNFEGANHSVGVGHLDQYRGLEQAVHA